MIVRLPKILFLAPCLLTVMLMSIKLFDPRDRLRQLHQDYPLIQAYRQALQSEDRGWLKLKDSPPLTQNRLRKIIQYLLEQFNLEIRQLRIEEQDLSPLKIWKINLIVGGQTDVEIWDLQRYLQAELAPLVHMQKFSLHRSGSLDESVVQQGNTLNLVEGRFELDWITQ